MFQGTKFVLICYGNSRKLIHFLKANSNKKRKRKEKIPRLLNNGLIMSHHKNLENICHNHHTHDVWEAISPLFILRRDTGHQIQVSTFFFSLPTHFARTWALGIDDDNCSLHRLPLPSQYYSINFLCSSRASHPVLS